MGEEDDGFTLSDPFGDPLGVDGVGPDGAGVFFGAGVCRHGIWYRVDDHEGTRGEGSGAKCGGVARKTAVLFACEWDVAFTLVVVFWWGDLFERET